MPHWQLPFKKKKKTHQPQQETQTTACSEKWKKTWTSGPTVESRLYWVNCIWQCNGILIRQSRSDGAILTAARLTVLYVTSVFLLAVRMQTEKSSQRYLVLWGSSPVGSSLRAPSENTFWDSWYEFWCSTGVNLREGMRTDHVLYGPCAPLYLRPFLKILNM